MTSSNLRNIESRPNILLLNCVMWVPSREFKQTLWFIWQIGSQYGGNVMISLITVSPMNPCDLTVFTQRNLFEQRMCKYGGYLNILVITFGHMASCN